jgi:ABC-2 type transport system ATP-binding protein
VDELLDLVDLSKRARDRVGTYSLGMKQRLGVAMALLPDPDLLILDEPANGLDPLGIIQVRDLLRHLRDQGKTILLSSHLLGELEQVTDWLVMINEGQGLFSGPARDLLAQRAELVVEAEQPGQLELVERLASGAGYTVTREDRTLRIICPASYADTLNQQIREAGAIGVTIQTRPASLESLFLALLKGEHA